jgi:hypothetical protein
VKVQCELCKEIVEIGAFRASPAGIDVSCGACRGSYFVPSGAPPADGAVAAAGPGSAPAAAARTGDLPDCPKCGAPQTARGAACVRCGLAAARFATYVRDAHASAPAALVELWELCRAAWGDPAAHDRFLQAAAIAEAYPYAASCYREALLRDPADPVARKRIAEVGQRAEAAILRTAAARVASAGDAPQYRKLLLLLVTLVALAALGVIFTLSARDPAATRDEPPAARSADSDGARPRPPRRRHRSAPAARPSPPVEPTQPPEAP